MKEYLSPEAASLSPYTPGEQPLDRQYVKLNTNESPFPPSPKVIEALTDEESQKLNLYSDPTCSALVNAIAERYGVKAENVIAGNGSDEILAFAFRAFCGSGIPAVYADITYSFYQAQTALFGLDATVIPLRDDFSLNIADYCNVPGTIFIANPNAPTGMAIPVSDIATLTESNPNRVVVIDEAYVDFGGESCVPLTRRYDNLLVVRTFSKSRSLAGGRIGFAIGAAGLISALNRVKYSFNPYNVNRLSLIAGAAAMQDEAYFQDCTQAIRANRAWTVEALQGIGFTALPSKANFVFAKSDRLSGEEIYRGLKERGVLVRWFDAPRLRDYLRITIGSREQMETLLARLRELLEGKETAGGLSEYFEKIERDAKRYRETIGRRMEEIGNIGKWGRNIRRVAEIERNTKETQIKLSLNLDGSGRGDINTGCGFLNHMLELFTRHGDFDMSLTCHGDTEVDYHHTAEDIGIALGQAFTQALGDKRGIVRYGQFFLPMDETLVLCAVDLSGRDCLVWAVDLPAAKVGDFDTELAKEFWLGFVRNCPCAFHVRQFSGENTHHILEAIFKGAGRALRMAVDFDPKHRDEIPSTKGVL